MPAERRAIRAGDLYDLPIGRAFVFARFGDAIELRPMADVDAKDHVRIPIFNLAYMMTAVETNPRGRVLWAELLEVSA